MTVKAKVDAIDSFVRTLKSSGLYDDINAACIMAGWTNLAGALYPLKGAAPTNNGFLDSDLDAGVGLVGDASKYLDAATKATVSGPLDMHMSAFVASVPTVAGSTTFLGSEDSGYSNRYFLYCNTDVSEYRFLFGQSPAYLSGSGTLAAGFCASSRDETQRFDVRLNGIDDEGTATNGSATTSDSYVFARNLSGPSLRTDATLSWYSIGAATDLAALDSAVSTLMADLRAIDEDGFDRDALAYIRNVEAADGAYLETGVKQAINRFIVGCKKDGIWDAIKASCILCGARTIAGALVPLAGTAPTAYNFTSANYNRETGLVGVPASSTYIDTNFSDGSVEQNDIHMATYVSAFPAVSNSRYIGTSISASGTQLQHIASKHFVYNRSTSAYTDTGTRSLGFFATNRQTGASYDIRQGGSTTSAGLASSSVGGQNVFVFAYNFAGAPLSPTDARLAFYSIGSAISDLSLLDNRVSNLVTEIAAAIS